VLKIIDRMAVCQIISAVYKIASLQGSHFLDFGITLIYDKYLYRRLVFAGLLPRTIPGSY